jgi:hypothetical protein
LLVISGSHEFERVYKDFPELVSRPAVSQPECFDAQEPPCYLADVRAHSLEVYGTCSECR